MTRPLPIIKEEILEEVTAIFWREKKRLPQDILLDLLARCRQQVEILTEKQEGRTQ